MLIAAMGSRVVIPSQKVGTDRSTIVTAGPTSKTRATGPVFKRASTASMSGVWASGMSSAAARYVTRKTPGSGVSNVTPRSLARPRATEMTGKPAAYGTRPVTTWHQMPPFFTGVFASMTSPSASSPSASRKPKRHPDRLRFRAAPTPW